LFAVVKRVLESMDATAVMTTAKTVRATINSMMVNPS
jgi:hypothetical protein